MDITNEEVTEIAALANRQVMLEGRLDALEQQVKDAKEELRVVAEELLPEAMQMAGMSEFRLASGLKVTVRDDVYASIRADYAEQACEWLQQNGLGDVIKDEVKINFGRGETLLAAKFLEMAEQYRLAASEKAGVHPQTLKALVKEQMAKGVQFPEALFAVQPVRRAKISTK